MAFVEEFKQVISKTIEDGDLDSTRQLLVAFAKTREQADSDIIYIYALYCYLTKQYAISLYWIKLCMKKYGENPYLTELLYALGCDSEKMQAEDYCNVIDITSFQRPLHILMYKGVIDIIDYTVDEFKNCYELLGHTVYILDISNENGNVLNEFEEIIKEQIDFVQIFNNNCFNVKLKDGGKDYLESLGIPCYDYMFDHPMYFKEFNSQIPNNYIVTCVDRNHNKYLDRFFNNIKNFFLPLGSGIGNERNIPWNERKICALYVGSLKKHSMSIDDNLLNLIVDYLIENVDSTTEQAIEICYREQINSEASDEEIFEAIEKYHYADMNVNYYFRKKLVKTLVMAGIDVDVYGYGWDDVDFRDNPHFHYGGWISQNDCLELMQETRFVLNSMPWFKDGIHDRVYNAMLAKAICITDSSKYMLEQFEDGRDIITYSLKNMDSIPRLISYYDDNPEEAMEIADNGYCKVITNHTWMNRSMELLTHYFSEL